MSADPICRIHSYIQGPPPCSVCLAEEIEAQAQTIGLQGVQPGEEAVATHHLRQAWMIQKMKERTRSWIIDAIIEAHDKGLSGSGES